MFTAVRSSWTPAHGRPTVVGPTGRQGPSGRSPAVGTYEGWVTSYGVCGHLLDSLSACDHSATLMNPEQARFGRLYLSPGLDPSTQNLYATFTQKLDPTYTQARPLYAILWCDHALHAYRVKLDPYTHPIRTLDRRTSNTVFSHFLASGAL